MERKHGRRTMAGDDYNFSVSITVAARPPAIFQRSEVRPVSIIIAQHEVSIEYSYIKGDLCEKRKDLDSRVKDSAQDVPNLSRKSDGNEMSNLIGDIWRTLQQLQGKRGHVFL